MNRREFLCQTFALPHTENFLNDFFPSQLVYCAGFDWVLLSRCLFLPYFNVPLLLFRRFCIPLFSSSAALPNLCICTYLVVISLFNIVKGGQEQSRERLKSLELSNINICMNVLQ